MGLRSDGSASVSLDSTFAANTAAGPLSFSAEVTHGPVTLDLDRGTLAVHPTGAGEATIIVLAQGANGGESRDTFAVTITIPCGGGAGPDTDFFPVSVGDVWTFDTEYGVHPGPFDSGYRVEGVTTWNFTQSECWGSTLRLRVREEFEGLRDGDEPVDYVRSLVFTRSDSLYLDQYTVTRIPASYPLSAPDTVETSQPSGYGYSERSQTLVRGRGPIRLHEVRHLGLGSGAGYETLMRVD